MCDNCPAIPNAPYIGTCLIDSIGQHCTGDEECGTGGFCSMNQEESDGDEIGDVCDNCPNGIDDDIDRDNICSDVDNCPATPNQDQLDESPPGGNNCGDACECEGNFDDDQDQDGSDAASVKNDFGRSSFNNPCEHGDPCKGDFDCDGDCDGSDAALFKSDFGRSPFLNPCPVCETGDWCVYPEE